MLRIVDLNETLGDLKGPFRPELKIVLPDLTPFFPLCPYKSTTTMLGRSIYIKTNM